MSSVPITTAWTPKNKHPPFHIFLSVFFLCLQCPILTVALHLLVAVSICVQTWGIIGLVLCFYGLFFSLQFFLAFGWLHTLSQCFCFLSDGNTTLADFIFPLLLLSLSLNPFKNNLFPCLYALSLTYFFFLQNFLFPPYVNFLLLPSLFLSRSAIGRTKCSLRWLPLSLWFLRSKICLTAAQ